MLEDSENLELFKSVHVQCGGGKDSAVEETEWLQSLADKNEFPHAFVVYSDLLNENIESEIEQHCSFKNTRGLRYLLNYDSKDPTHCFAPREVLLNNTWKNNYSLLVYAKFYTFFYYHHILLQGHKNLCLQMYHKLMSVSYTHLTLPTICSV